MDFHIGKLEFILTLLIGGSIILCTFNKEQKMVEGGIVGVDGFAVQVESAEDVYNALDGMHSQAMANLGEKSDVVNFLSRTMERMHEDFDLNEDELMAP